MGLETRPKTRERQKSSQLWVRCTQLCQQDLHPWEITFRLQTEMEFEINLPKVLQFLSVQKYKKLIYKHGTNVMNQSSHTCCLKRKRMVDDVGSGLEERAGERLCFAYSTCVTWHADLFPGKCENCWGRQQNLQTPLHGGAQHIGTPLSSTGEPQLPFRRVRSKMK